MEPPVAPMIELVVPDSDVFDRTVGWYREEWGRHGGASDLEALRARLVARATPDRIPFTLAAWVEGGAVGCLSVCLDDIDDEFADRGPWLSGMFVVGCARNLGVGRALLGAAEERARRLGASALWLHTAEAGQFYERCGWSFARRKVRLDRDAVMCKEL